MHDHDVSRLPVVRGGLLVGIIGRTDIVRAIVAEPSSPEARRDAGERAEPPGPRSTPTAIAHNVSDLAPRSSRRPSCASS